MAGVWDESDSYEEDNVIVDEQAQILQKILSQIKVGNVDSLPHRFFFYGTLRDDAIGTKYDNEWTEKFATGSRGFTARIYGFKLYQHKRCHFPFAMQTYNQNDYIIGRVMEFNDDIFITKLKHANFINHYNTDSSEEDTMYSQVIVDAYLEDVPENKNGKKGTSIKAISYFQKLGVTKLSDAVAVPYNDWMKGAKEIDILHMKMPNGNEWKIRLPKLGLIKDAEGDAVDNNEELKEMYYYPTPKQGAAIENKESVDDINNADVKEIKVDFKAYFYRIFNFGTDEITNAYYDKFEENGITNLELLMVCDDQNFLNDDIGMKSIHRILFLRRLDKLKKDHVIFEKWLDKIEMNEYLNIFINKGLLTFELFYEYITDCNGLMIVVGEQNSRDAQLIWTKTPKYIRQKETQTQLEGQ